MCEPDESSLREVTDFVWGTLLRTDIAPTRPDAHAPRGGYVGRVRITGSWEGALTLACTGPLARRAAGALFDMPPGEVTDGDVADALGEITNVMSGNVKALLPAPSRLSLPDVHEARIDHARAGSTVRELWFTCEGEPFVVRLEAGATHAS